MISRCVGALVAFSVLASVVCAAESVSSKQIVATIYKPRFEAMLKYAAVRGAEKGGTATPEKTALVKKRIEAGLAAEFSEGNAFTERWRKTYSEHLTPDELKALETFLATEAGRKFVALDAELLTTFAEDTIEWFSLIRARERGQ